MKKRVISVLILLLLFPHVSCDILRDDPLLVESWSPGTDQVQDSNAVQISLLFSHAPDHLSAENNFVLNEEGIQVHGRFIWDGPLMRFVPFDSLKPNLDYVIKLGSDTHDESGLSLEYPFEEHFSTRPPGSRPCVELIQPESGSVVDGAFIVSVQFSEAVRSIDCRNHISFSPAIQGTWVLEADDYRAVFVPSEIWEPGTRYTLCVSDSFPDCTGRLLGNEVKSIFSTGNDNTIPQLTAAWGADHESAFALLLEASDPAREAILINDAWEGSYSLGLSFNKPVDLASLRSCLHIDPDLSLQWPLLYESADSVLLEFEEAPPYGSDFIISLSEGLSDEAGNQSLDSHVFYVRANGAASKPPSLHGIRFPLAPGLPDPLNLEAAVYEMDQVFADLPIRPDEGSYPYDVPVESWIELYFDCAESAEIDLFSLMELFRLESTNNALFFSPRSIRTDGFTWEEPHTAWTECCRVELRGLLTNGTESGIVSFIINSGLSDKAGNTNGERMQLPLLK